MSDGELVMWVVYDHPRDFPNTFVARKWTVGNNHAETPTPDIIVSHDLIALREIMVLKGLICMNRHPTDEPQIVEVWL